MAPLTCHCSREPATALVSFPEEDSLTLTELFFLRLNDMDHVSFMKSRVFLFVCFFVFVFVKSTTVQTPLSLAEASQFAELHTYNFDKVLRLPFKMKTV